MKIKKVVNIIIIMLIFCLIAGIGTFIYNAVNGYKITNGFHSIPLNFNPEDSSSTYQMENSKITVYGGFVKGIQKDKDGVQTLVVRALSPIPSLKVTGISKGTLSLSLENVNADLYVKSIERSNLVITKTTVNTLHFNLTIEGDKTINIQPVLPKGSEDKYKYVILGDNRDGYETFQQIIQQVNGLNPVFVIDNGDLVFSGKPNQYRLFDQITSKISTTFCTALGNHDIRGNGRSIYTMLYGPPYYSFDFEDSHFIFLDSSPGWSEKRAISEEQYSWLEKDLIKAKGKRIFVISHIPPQDPRSGITKNEIPNYVNEVNSGQGWVEQKLNNYNENKDMEHGFQDPAEAERFEKLMSTYKVDTAYLSHIHSYFDNTKNGVRYLITGGAGAELLTKNSYYHYIIAKFTDSKNTTMVELPSPTNLYVQRYIATFQLFSNAMYEENPVSVVLILSGLGLLLLLLVIKIYLWKEHIFRKLAKWLLDTGRYGKRRFREIFGKADK